MAKSESAINSLYSSSQQLDGLELDLWEKTCEQNVTLIIGIPNTHQEVAKYIVKIKEIHSRVISPLKDKKLHDFVLQTNLQNSDLETLYDAETEIVEILRPALCKHELQNFHVNIENVQLEILDALHYLGLIYLKKEGYFNHYVKAAAIFEYCAHLSDKLNNGNSPTISSNSDFTFRDIACLVERDFLISRGKKAPDIKTFLEKKLRAIKGYKDELSNFREQISHKLKYIESLNIQNIKERTEKVRDLYTDCVSFFVDNSGKKQGLIQKLIYESMQQLGNPPDGCQHAFIGFGSLALGTMTPWSDLESAILVNDINNKGREDEYKEYFRNLTKLLWIKVINLGETPLSSIGIEALNNYKIDDANCDWFQDNVLNKAFRFDSMGVDSCKSALGRQGNYQVNGIYKPDYELIMTPQEMVEFQKGPIGNAHNNHDMLQENLSDWFYAERHLLQTLHTVALIDGSQELLDKYRNILKHFRKDNIQIIKKRAAYSLQAGIQEFSLKLDDNQQGELFNVKTTIYRLGDRTVNELANYYGIMAENGEPSITVWQIIDRMEQQKLLCADGAQHLREAVSIAAGLRLSAYSESKGRYDNVSIYEPVLTKYFTAQQIRELSNKIFYIEDTSILHHFYYVMVKVQNIIFNICNLGIEEHSKLILAHDSLYSDDKLLKALVHARLLEFASAKKYMDEIRQNTTNKLSVLHNLFPLYSRIGDLDSACKIAELALEISKDIYSNTTNNPHIILSYENLAKIYFSQKEYYKSAKCYVDLLMIKMQSNVSLQNELPLAIQMDIACIHDNLGHIFIAQKRYKAAIVSYEWSLEIKTNHCQERNNLHKISESYTNLARAYWYNEDYEKSVMHYKKSLEIIASYTQNANDPNIAINYDNLGDLYLSLENHESALEYYKLALKIKIIIYKSNPNHTSIADSHDKIGNVYFEKGEYDEAEEHYFQSLLMGTAVYGDDSYHPLIVENYNKLGTIYLNQGEIDDALCCYHKCFRLATQTNQETSSCPSIIKFFNDLENLQNNKKTYPYNTCKKIPKLSLLKSSFTPKFNTLSVFNGIDGKLNSFSPMSLNYSSILGITECDNGMIDITKTEIPNILELN